MWKKRKQTIKVTKNSEFISSPMKTNQRKAGKSLPDMYIQCKYKCLINKHPVTFSTSDLLKSLSSETPIYGGCFSAKSIKPSCWVAVPM